MFSLFYLSTIVAWLFVQNPFRDETAEYRRAEGRKEAERDIADGKMKLKIYGHLAGCREPGEAFNRLMRDRYEVEVEVIGLCTIEKEKVDRAEGYNAKVREELDRKFGPDTIERTWAEADTRYEQMPGGRLGVLGVASLSVASTAWWLVKGIRRRKGLKLQV